MSGNTTDPKEAKARAFFGECNKESASFSVKIVELEGEIQGLKGKAEELTKRVPELDKAIRKAETEQACNLRAAEAAEDSAKRQEARETAHRDKEQTAHWASTGIIFGGLLLAPLTGKVLYRYIIYIQILWF